MEIKEKARDRMELRIYAKETLQTIVEWIRAVNPSEWLPLTGKDSILTTEETKVHYRDYVDKGSKLIAKVTIP